MRLKRVRIFGFKTFADRTEFDLDGGVVAVVGPNGCGKSNLVDAILWALGETNSRHLRAGAGPDVIFGGSARRKPVGYAEVSLLFDNESGALPVDSSEVSLSRRLTRGGENEYRINGRACRLRDVQELLADSGLGRAGYAIVGQREIDAALSAGPEERRAWIDEAAGVQRYRARKAESLRRLAGARDHLSRVEGLVAELERNEEPLRAEAERAREARRVREALKTVEIGLLARELADAGGEIAAAGATVRSGEARLKEENDRAAAREREAAEARAALAALEARQEELRRRAASAAADALRAEGDERLADERLKGHDERVAAAEGEVARTAEARTVALAARDEAARDLAEVREVQREAESARLPLEKAAREARDRLAGSERALASARAEEDAARRRRAERDAQAARRAEVERDENAARAALPALERAAAEAEATACVADARLAEALAARDAAETARAGLGAKRRIAESAAREIEREAATLAGRKRGIEATIESHEGATQGAKAVLDAAARGDLPDVFTLVGAAIEAPKPLALAIEIALGGSANDLVAPSDRDAQGAIRHLKERRAGRATFQPLDLVRGGEAGPELRRAASEPGVLGVAADLVAHDARFAPVVRSLLGRVLLVETLDDGLRLARNRGRTTGWSRLVSREGEVVHAGGAVTGGTGPRAAYGLVQRRADLLEVEIRLAALERDAAEARAGLAAIGEDDAAARAALDVAAESVRESERAARASRDAVRVARGLHADAARRAEALARELAALAPRELPSAPAADPTRLQTERDAAFAEWSRAEAALESAAAGVAPARAAAERAAGALDAAARRVGEAERASAEANARRASLDGERPRLLAARADAVDRREEAGRRAEGVEARLTEAAAERAALGDRAARAAVEVGAARANAAALSAGLHAAELARARAETRRATAAERLMDVYGLAEADAPPPSDLPPDAPALVARLRREARATEGVNLGAVEAYEALAARLGELRGGRDDVLGSLAEIERGIADLDALTGERFRAAFTRVAALFAEEFARMFGEGGEGEVRLTDPARLLESGVELDVRLPGKRRQALPLLSGGERSLCALAFLFALLRVRPSPLVVLDEVDAPLDGRNVERFADALARLASPAPIPTPVPSPVPNPDPTPALPPSALPERPETRTGLQFIVVTHNPATIERAPAWLGVTMAEPGVSTLVPARL